MQARLLRIADIIETDTGPEVIRSIQIVAQLSNGTNIVFESNQDVTLVEPEKIPGRDIPDTLRDNSLASLTENTSELPKP